MSCENDGFVSPDVQRGAGPTKSDGSPDFRVKANSEAREQSAPPAPPVFSPIPVNIPRSTERVEAVKISTETVESVQSAAERDAATVPTVAVTVDSAAACDISVDTSSRERTGHVSSRGDSAVAVVVPAPVVARNIKLIELE